VVVEIPTESQQQEESKVDYNKPGEKPLKIVMSIKLPHLSIQDFDIDKNSNYVSLLTSEGEVKIYDLEQVE
jgi:hypothetical protein